VLYLLVVYLTTLSVGQTTHLRMIWLTKWKAYGKSESCSNLRHCPVICLEGLKKITRNLSSYYSKKLCRYVMQAPRGRRYSSYSFLTSALDGVSVRVTPRPRFTPGKGPAVPIGQEAGWAPELVRTQRLEKTSFASAGDRTPVVQSDTRLTELLHSRY
jgi:hypothetical protein